MTWEPEPDLAGLYDDEDPRRLSDEARERLAATLGITRAAVDAEIEEAGRIFDLRDEDDVPVT